jgi:thiol-disulfide isomerase/thioredoxin
MDEDKHRVELF